MDGFKTKTRGGRIRVGRVCCIKISDELRM